MNLKFTWQSYLLEDFSGTGGFVNLDDLISKVGRKPDELIHNNEHETAIYYRLNDEFEVAFSENLFRYHKLFVYEVDIDTALSASLELEMDLDFRPKCCLSRNKKAVFFPVPPVGQMKIFGLLSDDAFTSERNGQIALNKKTE